MNGFLPISKQDMTDRGWYYCDFLIVTGDAYVDHPSFGTAIISRVLEDAGYKVAILSQPDFRDEHDFLEMGRPRYAVLINGGNIDSMVAHYTSANAALTEETIGAIFVAVPFFTYSGRETGSPAPDMIRSAPALTAVLTYSA